MDVLGLLDITPDGRKISKARPKAGLRVLPTGNGPASKWFGKSRPQLGARGPLGGCDPAPCRADAANLGLQREFADTPELAPFGNDDVA